ncbi:MAG TPA: 3-phosphoshikimate 1-carboxyvinyltransferase [Terriglobales bacterium]|nr:3-phosphoshikimate 1-carboxyvinyltransferase [Terriglobales bacterium]
MSQPLSQPPSLPPKLAIEPLARPPQDVEIRVPGSKSITNRALLLAALAEGTTRIEHALSSEDTRHMRRALQDLGVIIRAENAETVEVQGSGGLFFTTAASLFAGNAGTAARFLLAAVCIGRGRYVIDGSPRMRQRPIADLVEALRQLGANLECPSGCPPVTVYARGLPGGRVEVSGQQSSQYLSALLMVAPYAESKVSIEVVDSLIAKPYIDMTIGVMAHFGAQVVREGYHRYEIAAGQRYRAPGVYEIEADASSAHYFLAAAALLNGKVTVTGIGTKSLQGDIGFVDVLERMGARVSRSEHSLTVAGAEALRGIDVDMNDISDTAPTLAVLGSFARTPVRIRNVGHLRLQESERIASVTAELQKLGAKVKEHDDGWQIEPAELHGGEVDTYDDHRLAMAFSLIGLRVPGIVIREPQCVAKTFPTYFEQLARLRQ